MQYLNKHVKGRQEVGHIDLLSKFAYIEVPEEDAKRVMKALNGTEYKGRTVRCNDADEEGHGRSAVADVILKEADAVRKVVVAEVLLMMQETLVILVEREDVEAVANLVAAENHAARRIQAIGASSSRTTTT